jgi:hypothetical protein
MVFYPALEIRKPSKDIFKENTVVALMKKIDLFITRKTQDYVSFPVAVTMMTNKLSAPFKELSRFILLIHAV